MHNQIPVMSVPSRIFSRRTIAKRCTPKTNLPEKNVPAKHMSEQSIPEKCVRVKYIVRYIPGRCNTPEITCPRSIFQKR